MSPEQIRELWSRFLAGEEISAEDQRALVDALDADAELRASLLDNLQLDGMLQAMNTTRRQGEGFVRNLTECLDVEHDGTRFVKKVELRLNEPPPPSDEGTGRRSKPPTTRIFRRRSSAPASGETAWKPALIAAAVFVAILLVVTSSTRTAPPRPVVRSIPAPAIANPEEAAPATPLELRDRSEELQRLQKLARIQSEQLRLETAPRAADEKPEDREHKIEATEEERRRIEEEIRTALRPRKATPGDPRPETTVAPAPAPAEMPGAVIEKVDGFVYIARSRADKRPAKAGASVAAGETVETHASGTVTLRFEDGTRVEVGPLSSFREMPGMGGRGRKLFLAYGSLWSEIAKQPPELPLAFITLQAKAEILGTTIRLSASSDPKIGTTLEVKEGKVQFTRIQDGKSADVVTGYFAVAATGIEIQSKKTFPDEITVRFGPNDLVAKTGQVIDSGEPYDDARGYGWLGPKDGKPIPGVFWRDPADGKLKPKHEGRLAVRRTTDPKLDPMKTTDVTAGWAGYSETWVMPIPNGKYLVSVCCGDATFEQGPHHVVVENNPVIKQTKNKPGGFVEATVQVEVKDGELTMKVGGYAGNRVSADGSSDTLINYLIIKRVDPRKK